MNNNNNYTIINDTTTLRLILRSALNTNSELHSRLIQLLKKNTRDDIEVYLEQEIEPCIITFKAIDKGFSKSEMIQSINNCVSTILDDEIFVKFCEELKYILPSHFIIANLYSFISYGGDDNNINTANFVI